MVATELSTVRETGSAMNKEWKLYHVLDEREIKFNTPLEEVSDDLTSLMDTINSILKKNYVGKIDLVFSRKFKEPSTDETLLLKLRKECEEVDE